MKGISAPRSPNAPAHSKRSNRLRTSVGAALVTSMAVAVEDCIPVIRSAGFIAHLHLEISRMAVRFGMARTATGVGARDRSCRRDQSTGAQLAMLISNARQRQQLVASHHHPHLFGLETLDQETRAVARFFVQPGERFIE